MYIFNSGITLDVILYLSPLFIFSTVGDFNNLLDIVYIDIGVVLFTFFTFSTFPTFSTFFTFSVLNGNNLLYLLSVNSLHNIL